MSEALPCPGCGTAVAPNLLTCPVCHRLVHADRLRRLADEAERAASPVEALVAWRSALELLPPGTRQYETVGAKIAALGRQADQAGLTVPAASATTPAEAADGEGGKGWAGAAGGLGTLALVAWKAKAVLLLGLTKGKLLLTGLAKLSTLSSMMLSIGVYAAAFGWRLAVGLVLSIYIHEMGHVAALMRYGIKATAPLFIPGVGALIRLRQALHDPRQDARVGLAGPLWGLFAAAGAAGVWLATGWPIWGAVAKLGASINLFNLMPLGSLDGGRAFHALTRPQRWFAVLAISVCWALSADAFNDGVLTLVLIVAALAALGGRPAVTSDRGALALYVALAVALTYLAGIPAIPPGAPAPR